MARSITFSRFPSSHKACTNSTFGNGGTLANSAFERFQFARKEIETRGIQIHHRRELTLSLTSRDDVPYTPRSYSPGERAKQLYEYINEKNLEALDEIISEDCCFEDFYFPTPFNGKKVSCVLASWRQDPLLQVCSLRCLDKSRSLIMASSPEISDSDLLRH